MCVWNTGTILNQAMSLKEAEPAAHQRPSKREATFIIWSLGGLVQSHTLTLLRRPRRPCCIHASSKRSALTLAALLIMMQGIAAKRNPSSLIYQERRHQFMLVFHK